MFGTREGKSDKKKLTDNKDYKKEKNRKRKYQIWELGKKIDIGMTKIPKDQRKILEGEVRQEKIREKNEFSQAESESWKLKSREKKMGETKLTTELEKIKKLSEEITKIVEILNKKR